MLSQLQLDRINANYCYGMGACYSNSDSSIHVDTNDFCIFYDQPETLEYNVVNIKSALTPPIIMIDKWESYFARFNAKYRVFVAPWFDLLFEPFLIQKGYQKNESPMRCMIMQNLSYFSMPANNEVTIKKVATLGEFKLFQEVLEDSYEYGRESGAITSSFMRLPNCELFLAYYKGEAAATSLLYKTDDIAGIYWVGTKKEYRNRGVGKAITWAAVQAGKAQGCNLASLQASDLGEPMYKKMGFDALITYSRYNSPSAG